MPNEQALTLAETILIFEEPVITRTRKSWHHTSTVPQGAPISTRGWPLIFSLVFYGCMDNLKTSRNGLPPSWSRSYEIDSAALRVTSSDADTLGVSIVHS